MSSIVSALSDLFQSIFEVIYSFFATAGHLIQNTISFVLHFFAGILNVVLEFFRGLVELAGGLVQFFLGNILILGVIAAAFFAYLQYQRNQGRTVKVGDKKLN
ncbi:hypothetical protein K469DRAFT_631229 [Zopfia rhizophila CBS 207.26]|uniref:Uncharacterized protein n=1 Tax=Zopfia rhizophila CBS 207.26 TaxID=1314779 RepID=A0A6A6E3A1_9PEZI|nr:hypothetical protein K469DRAFT_631229 [Zopfia rhizophila CBS 207.26]